MRNLNILIILIHVLLYVTVILDIPILRQCIGFIYLTFIPGFIIIRAIIKRNVSFAVELTLSVGVSIGFLMLVGLLANTLYPVIGISAPLSTMPILITISAFTLVLFVFSQIKSINEPSIDSLQFLSFKKDTGFILSILSIFLLGISIVGAICNNTLLQLFVIVGLASIFIASVFLSNRISSNCFMFLLFVCSLALVLLTSLISEHIMGWDIFGEYFVFMSVLRVGHWFPSGIVSSFTSFSLLNSILSDTILPTIYSTIMNLNGELILKTVFPVIFCFVPVILFKIFKSQLGKSIAMVSALFFIVEPLNLYGLGALSLTREMITYLFLVLIIFCFVTKDLDIRIRKLLIIAFSAGLAVSHYSLFFSVVYFCGINLIVSSY